MSGSVSQAPEEAREDGDGDLQGAHGLGAGAVTGEPPDLDWDWDAILQGIERDAAVDDAFENMEGERLVRLDERRARRVDILESLLECPPGNRRAFAYGWLSAAAKWAKSLEEIQEEAALLESLLERLEEERWVGR